MPQSLAKLYTHLVFSTKYREDIIPQGRLTEIFSYMAEIINNHGCFALRIGGTTNHVHILYEQNRTTALADIVRTVKACSSKWLSEQIGAPRCFNWQNGYGAFSVSPRHVDQLRHYIENQEEHHRQTSFQDEYRKICQSYNLRLDERFAWD